jgi:hypothetical protein
MLYNQAVADTRAGRFQEAEALLARLAAMGLTFPAAEDEDFTPLRGRSRFERLREAFAVNARPAGTAQVTFALDDGHFIPEGLAYDPKRDFFLLGSVRTGRIARVTGAGVGSLWPPAPETEGLSAFGMAMEPGAAHLVVAFNATREHVQPSARTPQVSAIAWLGAEEGAVRAFCVLDESRFDGVLGDVFVPEAGVAFAADSIGGAVYRVERAGCRFTALVSPGRLVSPQGMTTSADGSVLYVADYRGGLFALETGSGRLRRMQAPGPATLYGIDGLVRDGDWLIGVQNGLRPHRVIALRLEDGDIVELRVLAAGLSQFDEPTQGVVAQGRFHVVADSHWGRFDAAGGLPPADTLSGPTVLGLPLP